MTRRWSMATVLVVLMLTACAGIPTSGPVQISPQQTQAGEHAQELQPLLPPKGAKQDLIVQGFLHALAEGHGNYEIARSYLTSSAAMTWDPEAQTLVYSDDSVPPKVDPVAHEAVLKLMVVARLDARGTYTHTDENREFRLQLQQDEQGEWRITNPPPGRIISETLFKQAFAPMTLYFFDPTYTVLIPDIFYVPSLTINPNAVIRQVVRGPSTWTATMVGQSIPLGSEVGPRGVRVNDDGSVIVDLTGVIDPLDGAARTRLVDQLGASLDRSLRAGARPATLQIISRDAPTALPGQDGNGSVPLTGYQRFLTSNTQSSRELFGIGTDNRIYHIRDLITAPARRDEVQLANPDGHTYETLALSLDAAQIAFVVDQGTGLLLNQTAVTNRHPEMILRGTQLLRPQFTRFGDMWTIGRGLDGESVVYQISPEGKPFVIAAPGIKGVDITRFSISPDGMRMVVVGLRAGKPVIGEVQILRGPHATVIDHWRHIDVLGRGGPNQILDIEWRSDTRLVALAIEAEASRQVSVYDMDEAAASVRQLVVPTWTADTLATSPFGEYSAVGVGQDGRVFRRVDDTHWRLYIEGFRAVTFPG